MDKNKELLRSIIKDALNVQELEQCLYTPGFTFSYNNGYYSVQIRGSSKGDNLSNLIILDTSLDIIHKQLIEDEDHEALEKSLNIFLEVIKKPSLKISEDYKKTLDTIFETLKDIKMLDGLILARYESLGKVRIEFYDTHNSLTFLDFTESDLRSSRRTTSTDHVIKSKQELIESIEEIRHKQWNDHHEFSPEEIDALLNGSFGPINE